MPPMRTVPAPEPVEFSVEDVMMNTWGDDQDEYLHLEEPSSAEAPAYEEA